MKLAVLVCILVPLTTAYATDELAAQMPLSQSAISAKPPLPMTSERFKPKKAVFYVYRDRGDRENNFIPSGWMGSFKSIKFNPAYYVDQTKTNTCIKIIYSAGDTETSWAGIYWQAPANNWGNKKGGFDLSKYKKFKFLAKGEKGGELIDFFLGGITGQTEEGDSDEARLDGAELTADWKEYTLDLKGLDLSHIIGGFGWAASGDSNPDGIVFFLDEIRYEK